MKLSVIIPIYNVANYIERCARSLFEQTLDEIEYIFINDCTPDNSISILKQVLDDYPHRKPQTSIIDMPANSGQAAVRKCGMLAATGEYVINCDSDDWVDVEMYEKLYNFAVKGGYDMVWCDFFRSDGINHIVSSQVSDTNKEEILKALLSNRIAGSMCNRLYKRELHMSREFLFPQSNMTEDLAIAIQIVLLSSKIGYFNESLYYYYFNSNSICNRRNEQGILKRYYDKINNLNLIFDILQRKNMMHIYSPEVEYRKYNCKEELIFLTNKRKYRKLWIDTYPEINGRVWKNPLIHWYTRMRAFCLLNKMIPLYLLMTKMRNVVKS